MSSFKYVATDSQGKTIEGNLEAQDRSSAITALKKQDLRPISIKESGEKKGAFNLMDLFGGNKVKPDDLVMFTRQLSTMIAAGVPLLRSINSLHDHSTSKALTNVTEGIIRDVEGGATLADALAKYPNTFNDIYVNMVRAGEAAGILDDILKRLALQQEKSASMRKKVKSAMTYPIVLLTITILAFFGLMMFVIPQIGKIVIDLGGPDAELPMITQVMLGVSGLLLNIWYILIPVMVVSTIFIIRWLKTPSGKAFLHPLLLKFPLTKSLITKISVARFSRTFSALMGAGVAVLEALNVTAKAIGNVEFEKSINQAAEEVKNGKVLSKVIEANPLFPAIVAQMLSVGEETGQTDTVLVKVADFYEEEVEAALDGLSSIIEPVMIVVMGGMVGLIAASVMMPIAGLSQQIKG